MVNFKKYCPSTTKKHTMAQEITIESSLISEEIHKLPQFIWEASTGVRDPQGLTEKKENF